nr:hypothetical protein [Tanacetum cinerariifolium]
MPRLCLKPYKQDLMVMMQQRRHKELLNFNAPSTKSLDSIFNRLQKIVSQLAILGENISQEDLNMKFLRSLPSEWNTHLTINGSDTAGYDNTKVECFNCHKWDILQGNAEVLGIKKAGQGIKKSLEKLHMTGNISYLTDLMSIMEGMLPLGEELKVVRLLAKAQSELMCDKKNSVLFTDTECFVLSLNFKLADESQVLLKVPRENNIFTWVFLLDTKDETSRILKNRVMNEFCKEKDTKDETSRILKNRVMNEFCEEKARTMLADSLIKAARTMVLVVKPHFKTHYELFKGTNSNDFSGKGASFDAGQSSMKTGSSQDYILMPLWNDNSIFDSSSQASDGHNKDKHGPSQAINTATPTYADYPNDPLMPNLEDAEIFDDAYDDRD